MLVEQQVGGDRVPSPAEHGPGPAIIHGGLVYDPRRPAEDFHAQLPAAVRWKADNYNNLMEQPTLFYAVALTLALLGADAGLNTALAWLYVALRVAHSLVQATITSLHWNGAPAYRDVVPLALGLLLLAWRNHAPAELLE